MIIMRCFITGERGQWVGKWAQKRHHQQKEEGLKDQEKNGEERLPLQIPSDSEPHGCQLPVAARSVETMKRFKNSGGVISICILHTSTTYTLTGRLKPIEYFCRSSFWSNEISFSQGFWNQVVSGKTLPLGRLVSTLLWPNITHGQFAWFRCFRLVFYKKPHLCQIDQIELILVCYSLVSAGGRRSLKKSGGWQLAVLEAGPAAVWAHSRGSQTLQVLSQRRLP